MSVSTFATPAGSTDEGGTLVASATIVEAGSKVPATVAVGTYSITFYGTGSVKVYSYKNNGDGKFLGTIEATNAGTNFAIATVTEESTGFAFSGGTGTVVVRTFANSTSTAITDSSENAILLGLPSSSVSYWHRVATNGSRWVTIGSYASGTTTRYSAYSDDGYFWVASQNLPASLYWADITYGNGMFVAIAGNNWANNSPTNVIATSTDGVTWTQRTLPSSTYWSGITYGGGKFVVVSGGTATSSTAAAYSTDGVTWTASTMPSSLQWTDVEYGNGVFVAIATSSQVWASSTDGINWTSRTSTSSAGWSRISWTGNKFVVIANYGSNVQVSTNGTTWSNGGSFSGNSSYQWFTMDYANGTLFVASPSYNYISYSTDDGATWGNAYSPSTYNMAFLWNGSRYIAINSQGVSSVSTTDPSVNWTYFGTGANANNGGMYYVNGRYIALNAGSSFLYESTDGLSWTARSIGATQNWNSISYGNGIYLLTVGDTSNGSTQSSICYTSPNLTTWTQRSLPQTYAWKRAVFGAGRFVIPSGYSGTPQNAATSTDGINWSIISTVSPYGSVMCYGKGRFVALPQYAYASGSTSVDGVNWTWFELPSGHNPTFTSVAYGNGIFVAIASSWSTGGGPVYTSTDGVTWVKQTVSNCQPYAQHQISFANGYFAFHANNKAYTSTNGKTWTVTDHGGAYPMVAGGPQGILFGSDSSGLYAKTGTKITIN